MNRNPQAVLHRTQDGRWIFFCPGCRCAHGVYTDPQQGFSHPIWGWNRDEVRPTFTPSILVQWRGFTPRGKEQHQAWVEVGCPQPAPEFENAPMVCHSFVADGQIRFLSDCTHSLAGQTVALEPF